MKNKAIKNLDPNDIKKTFPADLIEYAVRYMNSMSSDHELVLAHGYLISPDNHLLFFSRMGDELIECARFQNWDSVKILR